MGEDPDAQHRREHQRRGDARPLTSQTARDEIGGRDPSRRRERIRQPQRKFVFAEKRRGDQHRPIDQRRFLHAGKAVAHGHKPVAALVHLAHRAGIQPLVVVEDHGREAGARIKQRDQSEDQPGKARRKWTGR